MFSLSICNQRKNDVCTVAVKCDSSKSILNYHLSDSLTVGDDW